MTSLTTHDGVDVVIVDADPTPGDPGLDQALLGDDRTYLSVFPRGFPDLAELDGHTVTWTAAAAALGVTLEAQLVAETWAVSTVNGTDPPDLVGPTVSWGPFDVDAGGQITVDLVTLMQPISDGTYSWFGLTLKQTAGDPLTVWTYAASDPALRPAEAVAYQDGAPEPSGISPGGGRIVSIAQPPISVNDYAAEAGDLVLDQIRLQWWDTDPGTDFSTPAGTLTQTTTEATVITAGTAFTLAHIDPDPQTYYRLALKPVGGPWGPWSPLEHCGMHSLGTLTTTDEPISLVPNPLRTWSLSGTQTMYRLTRARLEDPDVLLDPEPPPVATATEAGYVVGDHAGVLDFRSYVDHIEAWDDYDREAVPGGPDHLSLDVVWSLAADKRIEPPTMGDVDQLGGATPFPRITWLSVNLGDDFKVRRALVVDGVAGDWMAVSAELAGADVVIADNGESGFVFQFVDFSAAGGTHYRYYVERITDHRGSARSESIDIVTDPRWAYLVWPANGWWIRLLDAAWDPWTRAEPNSSSWAPTNGDGYYRRSKGDRLGVTTNVTAQIWQVDDLDNPADFLTAERQRILFGRMATTDEPILFVTTHETVEVSIGETAETPIDDENDYPWELQFSLWQTGPGTLTSSDYVDDGQVTVGHITFDGWTAGATIGAADDSGLVVSCAGSVLADPDAAAHNSLMGARLVDVSGGSNVRVTVDPENNRVDAYFPHGYPDRHGDHNVIRWDAPGSGSVAAVHIEQNGAFDIRSPDGTREPGWSSFHVGDDEPFRASGDLLWDAGLAYVRGEVWIGSNYEGTIPDIVITAILDCPVAPQPTVRVGPTNTYGGGDIDLDDIRIADSSSQDLPPLGEPDFSGFVSWANASAMSHQQIYSRALGIRGVDQVRLAYSTTANPDNTPATPLLGPIVDVDDYGTAGLYANGLTGFTRYYYAVADVDGHVLGGLGWCQTLPAPNTAQTLKMAHWSCQDGNPTGDPVAWPHLEAYGPHVTIGQGDFGYPGGTFKPTTPATRMLSHYEQLLLKLPPMRSALTKTSVEDQVSDHENCGNGQYVDPNTGLYDWPGQLAIFAHQIDAFAHARPVIYGDTRTEPRSRDYCKPLFKNRGSGLPSVMLHMFDNRGLDRSDGTLPDGPDKTFIGLEQWNRFLANKLEATEGLNLICFEGNWLATPNEHYIDKWWGFNWEQVNRIAPVLSTLQVLCLAGDRHMGGYLHKSQNPLGNFTVCLASAMEMHGLTQAPGEIFKDSGGVTRVFGNVNDPDNPNRQYGQLEITDGNDGTIGTDWTFVDAITDTTPFGTMHEDFTYV